MFMRLAVFITRWVTPVFLPCSPSGHIWILDIERIDLQIQFGAVPFEGMHEFKIAKHVSGGMRPPRMYEPPLIDKAWKLIKRCWASEAIRRPAMENILERMMAWKSA
jgi:hypothetical protein